MHLTGKVTTGFLIIGKNCIIKENTVASNIIVHRKPWTISTIRDLIIGYCAINKSGSALLVKVYPSTIILTSQRVTIDYAII